MFLIFILKFSVFWLRLYVLCLLIAMPLGNDSEVLIWPWNYRAYVRDQSHPYWLFLSILRGEAHLPCCFALSFSAFLSIFSKRHLLTFQPSACYDTAAHLRQPVLFILKGILAHLLWSFPQVFWCFPLGQNWTLGSENCIPRKHFFFGSHQNGFCWKILWHIALGLHWGKLWTSCMKFTLAAKDRRWGSTQCFFDVNLTENHPFGCSASPETLTFILWTHKCGNSRFLPCFGCLEVSKYMAHI